MKRFGPSLVSSILTGCAGLASGEVSVEATDYPVGWPLPVGGYVASSECVPIDGIYHSIGESNSELGERFSNPVFEQNFFYLNEIANNSNYFQVSQVGRENRLNFEIFSHNGELLVSNLQKHYSRCEGGWFVIESRVTGGSGDSPVKSTYRRTTISLALDGSLLINSHSEGVWRKLVVGSETRVSDIWYKFEKADPDAVVGSPTN